MLGVLLVVGLLAAGAILFILWLRQGSEPDGSIYEIHFVESVQGLDRASAVEMLGVRVGRVKEVRLDPANPGSTIVRISITDKIPVRQGARASITRSVMDGTATVALRNGSSPAPVLVARPGDAVPVILATRTQPRDRGADPENIVGRVSNGIEKISTRLGPDGQRSVERDLTDLARRSARWSRMSDHALRTFPRTQRIASAAQSIKRFGDAAQRLNDSVAERGEDVSTSIRRGAGHVERTAGSIDRALSDARPAVSSANRGQKKVGNALRALRKPVEAARNSVEKVGEPRRR